MKVNSRATASRGEAAIIRRNEHHSQTGAEAKRHLRELSMLVSGACVNDTPCLLRMMLSGWHETLFNSGKPLGKRWRLMSALNPQIDFRTAHMNHR